MQAVLGDGWPVLRITGDKPNPDETILRDELHSNMRIWAMGACGYIKVTVEEEYKFGRSAITDDGNWIVFLRLSETNKLWVCDSWGNLSAIAKLKIKSN